MKALHKYSLYFFVPLILIWGGSYFFSGPKELKVIVENAQKLPKWHPSAGEDAWLFVDEVLFW